WSSFTFEVTKAVQAGKSATIVIRCRDKTRGNQPRGKQSPEHDSYGCFYTRTTGIWQTVWLEAAPELHFKRPHIAPDLANKRFTLTMPLSNNRSGTTIRATARFDGQEVATAEVRADLDFSPMLDLELGEDAKLWDVGQGNLYDITLELLDADGAVIDKAEIYAGLRSIAIDGKKVKINGRSVFQRLVLDQGFYPDGVMTAPTDAALRGDLELAMAVGFNGARFHEKVFEERSLYHADQLGFLIWGEYGDCGLEMTDPPMAMVSEWMDTIYRDRSGRLVRDRPAYRGPDRRPGRPDERDGGRRPGSRPHTHRAG
ncbi:MAG: glycoside hydrolase family 2 protein, partial [Planctomycetota bacterium]